MKSLPHNIASICLLLQLVSCSKPSEGDKYSFVVKLNNGNIYSIKPDIAKVQNDIKYYMSQSPKDSGLNIVLRMQAMIVTAENINNDIDIKDIVFYTTKEKNASGKIVTRSFIVGNYATITKK